MWFCYVNHVNYKSLLSGGRTSGFSLPHLWCDDLVMFVRNTTDEIRRRNPTPWISAAQTKRILEYSSHIADFTDFSSHITSHSSMCMLSIAVLDFVEKSSFPGFATLKVYYSSRRTRSSYS